MITFLKSGILTTIQDLSRNGFRALGINPNGAMDRYAFRKLNIFLENNENEGMIELHFPAPEILFEQDTVIAIGGADFSPMIDNQSIKNGKMIFVKMGSVLKFQRKINGERAYLAIKGGFEIEKWLDSVSTNILAKIGGKKIEKGDTIGFRTKIFTNKILDKSVLTFKRFEKKEIRFLVGNEFQFLKKELIQIIENQWFTISKDSNRMGYRLASEPLELTNKIELLSSAVDFGTIQLLPNGQLIVLMADHQTTGGYPRIGHIISVDLPHLAQMSVGDSFRLKIVTIEEAERLFIETEKEFDKLKASIRLNLNN